jgi:hypothetical protein
MDHQNRQRSGWVILEGAHRTDDRRNRRQLFSALDCVDESHRPAIRSSIHKIALRIKMVALNQKIDHRIKIASVISVTNLVSLDVSSVPGVETNASGYSLDVNDSEALRHGNRIEARSRALFLSVTLSAVQPKYC